MRNFVILLLVMLILWAIFLKFYFTDKRASVEPSRQILEYLAEKETSDVGVYENVTKSLDIIQNDIKEIKDIETSLTSSTQAMIKEIEKTQTVDKTRINQLTQEKTNALERIENLTSMVNKLQEMINQDKTNTKKNADELQEKLKNLETEHAQLLQKFSSVDSLNQQIRELKTKKRK